MLTKKDTLNIIRKQCPTNIEGKGEKRGSTSIHNKMWLARHNFRYRQVPLVFVCNDCFYAVAKLTDCYDGWHIRKGKYLFISKSHIYSLKQ